MHSEYHKHLWMSKVIVLATKYYDRLQELCLVQFVHTVSVDSTHGSSCDKGSMSHSWPVEKMSSLPIMHFSVCWNCKAGFILESKVFFSWGGTQLWVGYRGAAQSFDHHPITKPEKTQNRNLYLNHLFFEGPSLNRSALFNMKIGIQK